MLEGQAMKKMFCICLAALIFFTGCCKSLSQNSKSAVEEKTESPQQKEPQPSMRTSILQFSSDLCFTVEDGFRDIASAAGCALYYVGYVFTSDSRVEYSYYPYHNSSQRTNGNAPYINP
jgi:hypothetical protein